MELGQQEKSDCIFSTYDRCAELAVSVLVSAAGALGGSPGVVEDEERRDLHRRRGSSCNSDTAATRVLHSYRLLYSCNMLTGFALSSFGSGKKRAQRKATLEK